MVSSRPWQTDQSVAYRWSSSCSENEVIIAESLTVLGRYGLLFNIDTLDYSTEIEVDCVLLVP